MKAISFSDFGPANQVLKVSDWPTPAPGPGEVLVKLHTTGVNPSQSVQAIMRLQRLRLMTSRLHM